MKKIFTLLATLGFFCAAQAQYALQKLEVNTLPNTGSLPYAFTGLNGKVCLYASAPNASVWTLNGQTVAPMPGTLYAIVGGLPMIEMGGKVYFSASDGPTGYELYEWDGVNTPALVADLVPLSNLNFLRNFVTLNGKLYFTTLVQGANNIWCYDPATKKTTMETNLSTNGGVGRMIAYKGKLVLSALDTNSAIGTELYEFDPQTKVMSLVADIYSGSSASIPQSFIEYNNKLYFIAIDAAFGRELWSYDGQSVVRVTDVAAGPASTFDNNANQYFAVYKGQLYFGAKPAATGALYRYDAGTNATTVAHNLMSTYAPTHLTVYGQRLYFNSDFNGDKKYMARVYDANGPSFLFSQLVQQGLAYASNFTVIGGKMYMSGYDNATSGTEPWVFTDSAALGVDDVVSATEIVVYPNPANTESTISFTLKKAAKLNITLSDMQGKVVYTATKQCAAGARELSVPVKEFATGVYAYTIANAHGVVLASGKLEKQ